MYNLSIPSLPHKRIGEALFILDMGQSNSGGAYPLEHPDTYYYQTNTKIKHWAVNPGGDVNNPADYSWQIMDISRPDDNALASGAKIGARGDWLGARCFYMAQTLQEQTGREVFVLHMSMDGASLSNWLPAQQPGSIGDDLIDHWPLASTAKEIVDAGISGPVDLFVWQQGHTDVSFGVIVSSYVVNFADNLLGFYGTDTIGWYDANRTYCVLGQLPDTDRLACWNGTQAVVEEMGENAVFVSSRSIDHTLDVAWHFTAEGAKQMGIRTAMSALAPRQPAAVRPFKTHGFNSPLEAGGQCVLWGDVAYADTYVVGELFLGASVTGPVANSKTFGYRGDFVYNTADAPDQIQLRQAWEFGGGTSDLEVTIQKGIFGSGAVLYLTSTGTDDYNVRGYVNFDRKYNI